ncbi:hypothetical protein ACWGJT_01980 [Streptomyces xantholiticus]
MTTELIERTATAWSQLTEWLRVHARTSHASILPPATETEIEEAEGHLRRHCGYGFPLELVALWAMAGGVRQLDIDEYDEEGEVDTGRFLPPRAVAHPFSVDPAAAGRLRPPGQGLLGRRPVGRPLRQLLRSNRHRFVPVG